MRYFDEITILRALAVLAVIAIHVSTYFMEMDSLTLLTTLGMAVGIFSHFAVPLFIFISGFVLYHTYPGALDLRRFYQKRLASVLPPYLIFSTFYLAFSTACALILSRAISLDLPQVLYHYATGGCFFHLWFFVLIIQLYLLYPLIVRAYNACAARGRTPALLAAVFLLGVVYTLSPLPEIPHLGVATVCVGYLFYFVLGMAARNRYDEFVKRPVSRTTLYGLSLALPYGTLLGLLNCAPTYFPSFEITQIYPVTGAYWHVLTATLTPLYYVIIFLLCLALALHFVSHRSKVSAVLEKIGRYSFGIYLVHAFILCTIVPVFTRLGFDWNDWLFYPVTFVLTLVLSYLAVEVIRRVPYSTYLIGSTR
ncbi:peptidoglycan/LPS O-acetylase OafA/YrhL [Methanofollis sp. W23]|uniref:acyltransferase n=1 Tax=Methanofollis sp. W23 TaxID=2817849 RepID=UPI001AE54E18|nr:acyltransferase [Methanofollis sp. W23]MBP2146268.1 peptidoglycan/LPS O-acetylase OafA/YrhL [Methanofollis sp. W23]